MAAQNTDSEQNELALYEKLKKIASETGEAKVIVKLDVKEIKKLTENSNRYKTVVPGRTFPFAAVRADLELKKAIHEKAFSVLHRLNGKKYRLNHTYSTLPYLALDVSPEALALLPTLPEVVQIFEDRPWKLVDNAFASTRVDSPMLDTSVDLVGAEDAWAMGYTGSGWYVVTLDTGIRRSHQFFQGKTIVEACFSKEGDCPNGSTEQYGIGTAAHYESVYDGHDHGTHVAGIAAGQDGSLAGVAKNSNIIAVQVFSRFSAEECDGSPCVMSWESDQVKGLEYVYTLRGTYSIAAVNMSLGGGRYSSYCDYASQKPAIDNLKAVHIATVIAAGNDASCGYVSSPACISSAVAVGASNDHDGEAYFNNWHSTLQEFFAPGVSIYSSTGNSDSGYSSWSGTSMSTPHVTGAWALLRQASSTSSVDTIFNALRSTGTPISSSWCSGGPIPRINVDEAINKLVGGSTSLTVLSPNGGENWAAGSTHPITWTSTGPVGNVKIEYSTNNGSSWAAITLSTANDSTHYWTIPDVSSSQCLVKISDASDGTPSDISDTVFSIAGSEPSVIMLSQTQFNFGAIIQGTSTGPQTLRIDNTGGGTMHWTVTRDVSWLTCTPSSGTNSGETVVSVNPAGYTAGSYFGTITVADPGAINSPQNVVVTLTVKNASQDEAPFGTFETPLDGAVIRGSVPLTGWALDDLDVVGVKIYRQAGAGLVYIGDAIFVEGARPDVAQTYPGYPKNYQAGWGYMLLSNFLPNGGNGPFVLTAIAEDVSGKQTILGSKTVNADNANAVKPFGAIDNPVPGGDASGANYRNSGWVLTPLPNKIPENGSTINVYVDGVYLGHPTYNIYRSDIAQLFPTYANSSGAHAYLDIDTTAYSNGIHTIYWTAADNAGNADGIGSRYFTIRNLEERPTQGTEQNGNPAWTSDFLSKIPSDNSSPVEVIKGCNRNGEPIKSYPDETGIITIKIRELERIELRFDENRTQVEVEVEEKSSKNSKFIIQNSKFYSGYQVIGDQLRPLPIGSTLDAKRGVFYWQPGPGFFGPYEFVFIKNRSQHEAEIKKNIKIIIVPK
jgi:subtilisin family serine protease